MYVSLRGILNQGNMIIFYKTFKSTYQTPIWWQHWATPKHAISCLSDSGSSKACSVDTKKCQKIILYLKTKWIRKIKRNIRP
jgi:hypothetical protein